MFGLFFAEERKVKFFNGNSPVTQLGSGFLIRKESTSWYHKASVFHKKKPGNKEAELQMKKVLIDYWESLIKVGIIKWWSTYFKAHEGSLNSREGGSHAHRNIRNMHCCEQCYMGGV